MASLRQYFETDFSNTLRVHVTVNTHFGDLESILHFDLSAHAAFLSCWIPGPDRSFNDFVALVKSIKHGETNLKLDGRVTLPQIRLFPGEIQVCNQADFSVGYRLYGDPTWKSTKDIQTSSRVFFYSEVDLVEKDVTNLQDEARRIGTLLQFRSGKYQHERTLRESPLAFICHDSRDKNAVARPIAVGLQQMLCPVWYDEFSLTVGANLREAIEAGIRECHRCILVLSPAFFSNNGWTKKEFDSIFSREVLKGESVVLPVWHGVTKEQVYAYSPGLLNVKGLKIGELGVDEVIRRLYNAIVNTHT